MSIARKDVRAKLDPDKHAALKAICDQAEIDMGEWIERVIVPVIDRQVQDAIGLAERLQRAGIAGRKKGATPADGNGGS